jgi:hypothetical protein
MKLLPNFVLAVPAKQALVSGRCSNITQPTWVITFYCRQPRSADFLGAVPNAEEAGLNKPPLFTVNSTSTATATAASTGTPVLVRCDVDCSLSIDGGEAIQLSSTDTKVIRLASGQHLIEASDPNHTAKWSKVLPVSGSDQIVLLIELQPLVANAAADKADAGSTGRGAWTAFYGEEWESVSLLFDAPLEGVLCVSGSGK